MTKQKTYENVLNITKETPHSRGLEQKLLSYIMMKPDLVFPYDNVDVSLFYLQENKAIYNSALYLWRNKKQIDAVNIYHFLSEEEKKKISLTQLEKMKTDYDEVSDLQGTIEVLLEFKIRRAKIAELSRCLNAMYCPTANIEYEISKLNNDISIMTANDNTMNTLDEVWDRTMHDLTMRMATGSAVAGMKSGIWSLDMAINGFQHGELVVVAGRPSMGKTAISVSVANGLADNNYSGLFFTLEQADTQILEKIICNRCNIPGWDMATGSIKDSQLDAIRKSKERIVSMPLKLDSNPRTSVSRVRKVVAREKMKNGLDFIVIDYLTYMDTSDCNGESDNSIITHIVKELKIIAKEFGICVILLAQLNRECEKRENKRPVKSDLRGSGAIEQEADKILFLYRDEYYNKETADKGVLEIDVAKFRNGTLGVVKTKFEGEYQRISSFGNKPFTY